jgi:hypothetical protein
VDYTKNLRAVASSRYILGLSGGLCNKRLLSRRPTKKRRSKKITSPRGALSVNPTTHKTASEKPTRSSEEEAEYQIPNSAVCLRYLKIR